MFVIIWCQFLLTFASLRFCCTGCVGAELLLGQPLFPGDSGVDQLVEIIKVRVCLFPSRFLFPFISNHTMALNTPNYTGTRNTNQRRNKCHELKLH